MTELLLELGFFLFVAVIFGAPLLFLVWLVARRRWWWVIVFGGALTITFGLGYLEILLEPPEGPKRVLFWPADLLIWAVGPGPRFPDGRYEWTPAHDMAMYVGYGASWAFWLTIARIVGQQLTGRFLGYPLSSRGNLWGYRFRNLKWAGFCRVRNDTSTGVVCS